MEPIVAVIAVLMRKTRFLTSTSYKFQEIKKMEISLHANLGTLLIYQHAKSQCCERTGSMITKNRFVIQQEFIFLSSTLSYQSQRYVSCSFSAKFLLKIASNTAPLAIGIRPYGMDCLNESYHKSEQNQIMQAMFLIHSLTVLSIIMDAGKPL